MKYKLFLLLSLMFFAGVTIPVKTAAGQTPKPEMNVSPAFDGYFKYGEWLPIYVELENPGQDLEAEVQVRVPRSGGGVTFSAPVSLPAGAHKLVPLYILPNTYSHSLDVKLVQNGETLATQKAALNPIMNIEVLIGLVASNQGALSLLKGIQYPNNGRPVNVVNILPDQLPARLEGLRSFDVLVVNDTDTSQLTLEQTSALRGWLQNGGRLVIGGGAGTARTLSGLPEDLLPVKISGEQKAAARDVEDLSRFSKGQKIEAAGEFVLAQAAVTNGEILAGDTDLPLVVEKPIGAGDIDFVALDLSSAPFEGWSGTGKFWETLLSTANNYYNGPSDISIRSIQASNMANPLSMIPSMELPSIKWLTAILVLYILIVGPANYFVLKKKNRLHWAWITIPGITILFSAAAFGSGYLMRGSNILIHKIGIMEIQPEGSAHISSYMGLFSPSEKSYQVEVSGDSLLSPIVNEYEQDVNNGSGSEISVVQGKPNVLRGLSVSQWSMQSFMTEETIPNPGKISGDLKIEDGNLTGTVRNELTQVLKDVTVVIRNQYFSLGDVNPGQEAAVNLKISSSPDPSGMPFFYAMYEDKNGASNTNNANQNLINLKRSILSPLFDTGYSIKMSFASSGSGGGGGGGGSADAVSTQDVLVFGWIDQFPPDVSIASSDTFSTQSLGLVYTYLDYHIANSGKVNFPPGILSGKLISSDSGTCSSFNQASFYMERNMKAQVEYQLPSPRNYDFQEIDLHLTTDGSADTELPEVSLFNWSTRQWFRFSQVVVGLNIIQQPDRYISPDGKVRIQLAQSETTVGGSCKYLEMGFKAEGKGSAQ